jgi:spore coat polysaccharide biosynthesis protein SpsF (cytidylyltransferase family)
MQALETANQRGSERHRSELCTLFIVENSDSFSINVTTPPETVRRPDVRLTVDNPEDLVVARRIWERLPEDTRTPRLQTVLQTVDENPGITDLNSHLPDGTDSEIKEVRPFMYGDHEV